jgi:hypothetical protein
VRSHSKIVTLKLFDLSDCSVTIFLESASDDLRTPRECLRSVVRANKSEPNIDKMQNAEGDPFLWAAQDFRSCTH